MSCIVWLHQTISNHNGQANLIWRASYFFAVELPSLDAAKPPAKKSKFKVQREKSKEKVEYALNTAHPHAACQCTDIHFCIE